MKFPRASGILLHPSSLPGSYGIGDLGDAAYRWVDFLAAAGQSYWQVLPLSPTGYGNSPYQAVSALAGNPMLISPEKLAEQGHLCPDDFADTPPLPEGVCDYLAVLDRKSKLLDRAFERFRACAPAGEHEALARFTAEQAWWLDDFALFMALKEAHNHRPWYEWDPDLKKRRPEALTHWRALLLNRVQAHQYRQWQFFSQWSALKRYANERRVRIIGDIPIFVSRDSADVWANPHLFYFDEDLNPTVVSGVPPDYFSVSGQLWGHPLYRWDVMAAEGYAWWIRRFRMALTQADVLRIDHFRAFHNYWEVPAGEKTAINGRWRRGPGAEFFRAVQAALGEIAIIAEDLGSFDKESRAGIDALEEEFGFPGMKVLQFAFDSGPQNDYLPHNYTRPATVVYTGTHDNDTVVGWYQETASEKARDYVRRYIGCSGADIAWDLIRLAWASVAETAITTAQDLLSLGHEARLNTPATSGPPNWCWRLLPGTIPDWVAPRLRDLTFVYGRLPEEPKHEQEEAGRS